MMQMPAKCPQCFGEAKECGRCGGSGTIDVTLPEGDWYTQHCNNADCGFDNGGCQGSSLGAITFPCVMCGSEDVVWMPMCDSDPDTAWKRTKPNPIFAEYLLALEGEARTTGRQDETDDR